MVARPIGAASAPPVAASRSPPFSTSTATATLGALGRRERDVPGVRRGVARVGPVLRGAGLRCDLHAGDGSLLLRHLLGVDHQIRQCIGDLRRHRAPLFARQPSSLILARSGPLRLSTRYGCIVTPSFAMVAATSAFCSGVSATSFCPMLDMPSAAASAIGPTVDSATCSGIGGGLVSRPNACARTSVRRRRCRCRARRMRCCTTSRTLPAARRSGRRRTACRRSSPALRCCPATEFEPRPCSWVSRCAPVCSAAAVVITLNVDPGG